MEHYKGEIGVPMVRHKREESKEGKVKGQNLIALAGKIERETGIPCKGTSLSYLKQYIKMYG